MRSHLSENTSAGNGESDEELMKRLIAVGLQGDMEEINALDNRANARENKSSNSQGKEES